MAVETFKDLLTPEDIQWFRDDFQRLIDVDPVSRPYEISDSQRIYDVECDKIDQRHILSDASEGYHRMKELLSPVIPRDVFFYMAYQRQFLPHQLHVDSTIEDTNLDYAKSAIVPLDDNPGGIFKTVVWDKYFLTNEDLQKYFQDFIKDSGRYPSVSSVSKEQDVDHCWSGSPNIVDSMLLDGVYHYELGSIGMFDRTHVHCSSNWRKYKSVDHKDIVLLHIG